ncbi:flavin reductase [Micromonospora sp. NPDC051196]|uniref:flavin reductase n=1 Tax=Micromonospora sp. NPDC051196 TaxID=3155281 RepID=UPI003423D43E
MRRPHLRDHVPSRPTWRCQACGSSWPCSPAKLRLLAEYRNNMPGLLVHLVTLREQATEQLADLHPDAYPTNLHQRFTDWVPIRTEP